VKIARVFAIVLSLVFSFGVCANAAVPSGEPQIEGVPDMPGSSMWIPWSDFKDILEKLIDVRCGVPDAPPPYDAVVSSADYSAEVGEGGVTVAVAAKVFVLKQEGWALVPVMKAGAPVSDATLDGKPTALVTKNDGILYLVLKGFGIHELAVNLELEPSTDRGARRFVLPTVLSQVNHLEVRIGRPDIVVKVSPGGQMESRTVGSSTVATGSFPPADQVTVSWARSVPRAEKEAARVSAEVRTMLTVGEGLGVYTAIVDFDIQHKPVSEFVMALPSDVTVADVSTEGLVDWRVSEVEGGKELAVSISYEALGYHQVAVTYENVLPSDDEVAFEVVCPIVKNVVHEVGYLAVAVTTNVQVDPKEGSLENLVQIDPSELPPDLRGSGDQKVLYGFKYIKHPSRVELDVVRHKDASVLTCEVEQADYKVMLTDEGKQIIEATYRIANRSLQYLALTLPEGADLWGVYRDGEPIKAAEDDGKILLPVFQGGMHKTFNIKILAYRKTGKLLPFGSKRIGLPTLGVGVNRVNLTLYLPERFRYFGFGGKLRMGQGSSRIASRPSGQQTVLMEYLSAEPTDEIIESLGATPSPGESAGEHEISAVGKSIIKYRAEQSQVQPRVSSAPVQAANVDYIRAMTRGALPVEFDVAWEGTPYHFSTLIVDPKEETFVKFFYGRRVDYRVLKLLAFLLAAYIGYLLAKAIIARRHEAVEKPRRTVVWLIVLVLFLFLIPAGGLSVVFLGFVLGFVIMLFHWRAIKKRIEPGASSEPSRGPKVESPPEKEQPQNPEGEEEQGGSS